MEGEEAKLGIPATAEALCELTQIATSPPPTEACDESSLMAAFESSSSPVSLPSEFEREPAERIEDGWICPAITTFLMAGTDLEDAITDYEYSLAFDDWMQAETTRLCGQYRVLLTA